MSTAPPRSIPSDIEINRKAKPLNIQKIAEKLGLKEDDLEPYGKLKAKVSLEVYRRFSASKKDALGKLVLVTAVSPTPAGEGKTTTSIGLVDGMNRIGEEATVCLREPSLGPCFGMKGGAAGGGYAQVLPMEDINLHFTGDIHAIEMAHNLLSAIVDNHIHHGKEPRLDPRRVTWNRVVDMNDRALRNIVLGLGGTTNGVPRESGYDISVASEVMAIFCLSESLLELRERLGKIIVGYTFDLAPVTAKDLKAHGAMTVLLKDAFRPNLVQTLENNPAFIHGGPFANIAHGCNSIVATKLCMGLSKWTVTEAGFGADLGAEKFLDIKCRKAGIHPNVVVIVATIRALKMHGGVELKDLHIPNVEALGKGVENLKKHIENIHKFGLPVVVAVNMHSEDTPEEFKVIKEKVSYLNVSVIPCEHWAKGGEGCEELARAVVKVEQESKPSFQFIYPSSASLWDKVVAVCREVYGAQDVLADKALRRKFAVLQNAGFGDFPVCIAKTQYSLSTDPLLKGRPAHFDVPLRDVRVSAGAGFAVVITGSIMTMPGLPKVPAAEMIDIDENEEVIGLF